MKCKTVELSIELNVECQCGAVFDLFKNSRLTDDGFLYDLVLPKSGPPGCKDFHNQLDDCGIEIKCPECNERIEIESVDW